MMPEKYKAFDNEVTKGGRLSRQRVIAPSSTLVTRDQAPTWMALRQRKPKPVC